MLSFSQFLLKNKINVLQKHYYLLAEYQEPHIVEIRDIMIKVITNVVEIKEKMFLYALNYYLLNCSTVIINFVYDLQHKYS